MNLASVEKKWQKKWAQAGVFEPSAKGQKKFVTVPYPYTSGPLHIGHARTYTLADIWARYYRMQGFSVLFPMAFHISGTPILAVSDKIKAGVKETIDLYNEYVGLYEKNPAKRQTIISSFTDPAAVAAYFSKVISRDFSALGFSIDWSRSFTTGDKSYQKFIEWQFLKLMEKGVVTTGSHAVQFCLKDNNPVGEDDIKDGDTLDTRIETYTIIKFSFKDGYLPVATVRPETVFGATNLWVNPNVEYIKARVDGEYWYLSKDAALRLEHQNHKMEKLGGFPGALLAKEQVTSLVDGRVIPIHPASFVSADVGTGVVMSVPAHAPDDYAALRDLGDVPLLPVVSVPGYGSYPAKEIVESMGIKTQEERDRLKEATKKIYKDEFYNGTMVNAGRFTGMKVQEAKEHIRKWMKDQRYAEDFFVPATPNMTCRCGGQVVIKIISNQWFIDYGKKEWKARAHECLSNMTIVPESFRQSFSSTIDWLHERACARRRGLGTHLPWDNEWIIDSLSDSTMYPLFYILAPHIKKVPTQKLVPELFDYVILGKGEIDHVAKLTGIKKQKIDTMRKDVLFWYPVDLRHTATPHVSNHLTFYIFTHSLLLPKEMWPKGISLNELLIRDGAKMSKSRGNVIPLAHVAKRYSADLYRLYISYSADLGAVVDWTDEGVGMVRKRLHTFIDLPASKGKRRPIDAWLESRFQRVLQDVHQSIPSLHLRPYVQRAFFDLMNDVSYYQRRGGTRLAPFLKKWVKLLTPLIPHVCEERWSTLGGRGFVSTQLFPQVKEELLAPAVEAAEDLIRQTREDVREIEKIVQKKPQRIVIHVSPSWKYVIRNHVRAKGMDTKALMQLPEARTQGKNAIMYAQKAVKDHSTLTQEDEHLALKDAIPFLKKECGCPVEVVLNGNSPKAQKAEPGKPGIEVF